ncbi:MAG TPA: peptidylprolyl isomerase, partial [Pseudoduganella sp.]
ARHDDPNSGQSQWFINVADNIGLDFPLPDGKGYAVFGRVIQGKETVDKIKAVLVDDKPNFQNLPVTPIVVKSVTVLKTRTVPPPETPAAPPAPEPQAQPQPAPAEPAQPPAEPTPPAPTPEAVK